MKIISIQKQRGAETLEFLAVFFFFMLMFITVLDFARAVYTLNTLTEATRRGARMAVVCPETAGFRQQIQNVTVFDGFAGGGTSPVVPGLTSNAVLIQYYDQAGVVTAVPQDIRFVEVEIDPNQFQFQFLIPGFSNLVSFPPFRSTLYTESLGAVPTAPGQPIQAPDCNF